MTFSKGIHIAVSERRGTLIKIIKFEKLWLRKKLSDIRSLSCPLPPPSFPSPSRWTERSARVNRYGNRYGNRANAYRTVQRWWFGSATNSEIKAIPACPTGSYYAPRIRCSCSKYVPCSRESAHSRRKNLHERGDDLARYRCNFHGTCRDIHTPPVGGSAFHLRITTACGSLKCFFARWCLKRSTAGWGDVQRTGERIQLRPE